MEVDPINGLICDNYGSSAQADIPTVLTGTYIRGVPIFERDTSIQGVVYSMYMHVCLYVCMCDTVQVDALIQEKLEPDIALEDEVTRNWAEIILEHYHFDRLEREVRYLSKM